VVIVLESEFEPAWRRAVELTVVAKLCDFLEGSFFKVVMASILQELDQSHDSWVPKPAMESSQLCLREEL
jgi:hypothetical protein